MEEKVIGKRFILPFTKGQIFGHIMIFVVAAIMLIFSFLYDSYYEIAELFLIFAIVFFVLAVVSLVAQVIMYKKRKKREGIPTIVALDDRTLKLFLTNGEEKEIDIYQVQRIDIKKRIHIGVAGVNLYSIGAEQDGSIIFYMQDGTRVKVKEVADVEKTKQEVLNYTNVKGQ